MKRGWMNWVWVLVGLGATAVARADVVVRPRSPAPLPSSAAGWGWIAFGVGMGLVLLLACFLPSLVVFLVEAAMKRRDHRWTKAVLPLSAAAAATLLSAPVFDTLSRWAFWTVIVLFCAVLTAVAALLARQIGWKRWCQVCFSLLAVGTVWAGVAASVTMERALGALVQGPGEDYDARARAVLERRLQEHRRNAPGNLGVDGEWTYSISDGVATVTGGPVAKRLKIPSRLGGRPVAHIGKQAFRDWRMLERIVFPKTLETIGESAFYGAGLETLELPRGVRKIGDWAFAFCQRLEKVVLPDGVKAVGDHAFQYCGVLKSFTFPNSIERTGYSLFRGCSRLKAVSWPESLSCIESNTFESCQGLVRFRIPVGVTDIRELAFDACTGLARMELPACVTNVGKRAFFQCRQLEGVDVDPGNPAFASVDGVLYSKDLKTLLFVPTTRSGRFEIPDGVESIGANAFEGCTNLVSVGLPEGLKRIGEEAFHECVGLKSVRIPDSVEDIGAAAFNWCKGLEEAVIGNGVTNIGWNAFLNDSALERVVFGKRVEEIGGHAFAHCTRLRNIALPEGVREISDQAFSGCSGLESVVLPDSVTVLGGGAFRDCTRLSSLRIGRGVEELGGFSGCRNLRTVTIPDNVKSVGYGAFEGCSNLAVVAIGRGVTNVDPRAFRGCAALEEYRVHPGNERYAAYGGGLHTRGAGEIVAAPPRGGRLWSGKMEIAGRVRNVGNSAFAGCTGVTSFVFGEGVTNIGSYAFSGCTGLTSVVVRCQSAVIGERAFMGCTNLSVVCVPAGWNGTPRMGPMSLPMGMPSGCRLFRMGGE